jgi:hypothetical protein
VIQLRHVIPLAGEVRLRFVRTGMNVTVGATHRLNELAAKSQPAGEKVRAYYQSSGFDMPAMLAR